MVPFQANARKGLLSAVKRPADVSKADICSAPTDVRFTSESRHAQCNWGRPLWANSGLMHQSKKYLYSINLSARASSAGDTVRPRVFAVLRFMTSSNFVGACTGSSAGLAPLRMRSTYDAASRNSST